MSTLAIATAKEVFDLLHDDLRAIEREFGSGSVSPVAAITEISGYLREGGGKRIRPSLLLLSAKSQGYSGDGMIRLGAVVEMVHTATLVHDDIIDAATRARGRPSAEYDRGNAKCVLAGDWLYMQAFRDGFGRAQLPDSGPADRAYAADGRGRAAADGEAGPGDFAKTITTL